MRNHQFWTWQYFWAAISIWKIRHANIESADFLWIRFNSNFGLNIILRIVGVLQMMVGTHIRDFAAFWNWKQSDRAGLKTNRSDINNITTDHLTSPILLLFAVVFSLGAWLGTWRLVSRNCMKNSEMLHLTMLLGDNSGLTIQPRECLNAHLAGAARLAKHRFHTFKHLFQDMQCVCDWFPVFYGLPICLMLFAAGLRRMLCFHML